VEERDRRVCDTEDPIVANFFIKERLFPPSPHEPRTTPTDAALLQRVVHVFGAFDPRGPSSSLICLGRKISFPSPSSPACQLISMSPSRRSHARRHVFFPFAERPREGPSLASRIASFSFADAIGRRFPDVLCFFRRVSQGNFPSRVGLPLFADGTVRPLMST